MARSMAAIALLLFGSAAAAATNGNGNAPTAGGGLAAAVRAGHPNYVAGGWVCPPGFAWRNAGRQDWLCVDPAEARRIASENRDFADKAVREADGTFACPSGLVRRDASHDDDVCVAPARQAMVHQMNLALFDVR